MPEFNREAYEAFVQDQKQLLTYLADLNERDPLLDVLQQYQPDLNLTTIDDVSTEKVTYNIHYPRCLLEISYHAVKARFVGDRWTDLGNVTVKLVLKPHGRVLHERIDLAMMIATPTGVVASGRIGRNTE